MHLPKHKNKCEYHRCTHTNAELLLQVQCQCIFLRL